MNNDLTKSVKKLLAINPQATITATTTSAALNLDKIIGNVNISMPVGVCAAIDGTNYFTMTITQSKTLAGTYTAAEAWQYNFSGTWGGVLNVDSVGEVLELDFKTKPDYKYIRVVLTATASPSAFLTVLIQFNNRYNPVT